MPRQAVLLLAWIGSVARALISVVFSFGKFFLLFRVENISRIIPAMVDAFIAEPLTLVERIIEDIMASVSLDMSRNAYRGRELDLG